MAMRLTQSVYFVGFMGAGKTSVARRLARMCGAAAIDADIFLSRQLGVNTTEFIQSFGESAFREQETLALHQLVTMGPAFVALGGGVIEREENRELLKQAGCVVFLDVTASQAANRINNLSQRPLFQDVEHAQKLNDARRPKYEDVASITIATKNKKVANLALEVVDALKEKGVLIDG